MSIYPPPPPGWDSRLLSGPSADKAPDLNDRLAEWALARGYEFSAQPSAEWYQSWAPFVFLFKPTQVHREVRANFGDAQMWLIEAVNGEEVRNGGDGRYVLSFLLSSKLHCRCAIRARMQTDAVEEMRAPPNARKTPRPVGRWRWRERDQFLRRTYGRGVRGVIGDAIFEAHMEIQTPSREEGLAALPVALRQWLISTGWRGVLELRPGGLVSMTYAPPLFDPASLDATIHHLGHVFDAATRASYGDGEDPASGPQSGPFPRR